MWIKVSITGHDAGVGLPDIDEIREVGKAAHFCNKEVRKFSLSADCRLLAWPTFLPVFNMSINPVKSQYTQSCYRRLPANLGRIFFFLPTAKMRCIPVL